MYRIRRTLHGASSQQGAQKKDIAILYALPYSGIVTKVKKGEWVCSSFTKQRIVKSKHTSLSTEHALDVNIYEQVGNITGK